MGFLNLLYELWRIGNYWLRAAIVIVASWPVPITLAAFIGWPALTATVALLPLFALVIVLMTIFDPLVLAALVPFGFGRRTLVGLAGIIGLELAVGAYFAAVPVANDRGLIPLQLLLIVGIAFLAISGFRKVAVLLGVALVIVAAISFMGGREKANERWEQATASASAPSSSQVFVVGPKDEQMVVLPPNSWFLVAPDKPILIRLRSEEMFEQLPNGKLFKREGGGLKEVPNVGDFIPGGILYIRAKEKMARVTISTVRK